MSKKTTSQKYYGFTGNKEMETDLAVILVSALLSLFSLIMLCWGETKIDEKLYQEFLTASSVRELQPLISDRDNQMLLRKFEEKSLLRVDDSWLIPYNPHFSYAAADCSLKHPKLGTLTVRIMTKDPFGFNGLKICSISKSVEVMAR